MLTSSWRKQTNKEEWCVLHAMQRMKDGWYCVNVGVEELGLSWVAQYQYWHGGIWAETWRKRESVLQRPGKTGFPEGMAITTLRQGRTMSVWATKRRVPLGEKSKWGVKAWCEDEEATGPKAFGFYSKCNEKPLEGFKQGSNVIWFMVLKDNPHPTPSQL